MKKRDVEGVSSDGPQKGWARDVLNSFLGVGTGVASGVAMGFMTSAWRDAALAAKQRSELEQLYVDAFKDATLRGCRTHQAHFVALRSVYDLGYSRGVSDTKSFRRRAGDMLQRLGRKLAAQ